MSVQVEKIMFVQTPLVVILRDEGKVWLASAASADRECAMKAVLVSEAEAVLVKLNRISLRGVTEGRPWREVTRRGEDYDLGEAMGEVLREDDLDVPGMRADLDVAPDSMPHLQEDEVLFDLAGPKVVVLDDGAGIWMATARRQEGGRIIYMASPVSQAEATAIAQSRISLRAAYLDRPWVEIVRDEGGYRFGEAGGPGFEEYQALPSGAGLGFASRNLPDRLEIEQPSPGP